MLDFGEFDFNTENGPQRGTLREVLQKVFPKEATLRRFLDENLDIKYDDFHCGEESRKDRMYSLIVELSARGGMSDVIEAIAASDDYSRAPALQTLHETWHSLARPEQDARFPRPLPKPQPAVQLEPAIEPAAPAAERPALTRIFEAEDSVLRPVSWLKRLSERRHAMVLLRDRGQPRGTGFLVGPKHVLTCGHVLTNANIADAVLDFEDQTDFTGVRLVKKLLASDPDLSVEPSRDTFRSSLDYALWEIETPPKVSHWDGERVRRWLDLGATRLRLHKGESVFLLHFPRGQGMRISEGKVLESDPADSRFTYDAPTESGSSGAPVFDTRLRLIGLHEGYRAGVKPQNVAIRADHIGLALEREGFHFPPPPNYAD